MIHSLRSFVIALLLATSIGLSACGDRDHDHDHEHEHEEGEHAPEAEESTTISPAAAEAAGMEVAVVAPAMIRETLAVYGVVIADPQGVHQIRARFPGAVVSAGASLGQRVARGATLATIESNESLQRYAVTAPIAGQILERHVNAGETVSDQVLFTVGDLSSVWAEFAIFRRDLARVRVGQAVNVTAESGDKSFTGKIVYIQPVGSATNQSLAVRVSLDNSKGEWPPGVFVTGRIVVAEKSAAVAVRAEALQTFEGRTAVFLREGERYSPRFVQTGMTDGELTEILSGVELGAQYVTVQSYIVKADLEKSGAAHSH